MFRYSSLLAAVALCFHSSLFAEENEFYDPVERTVEGWTVQVDPELLKEENEQLTNDVFKALANHLQRVEYILPEDRADQLKKLPIWIDLNHELGSMQYHPEAGWLKRKGYDPRLEKHVHIPRARSLINRGTWAKHPYVILHELAHAYHDQVLTFDHPDVLKVYNEAKDKGIYDEVLLFTGRNGRHYALTNHKEYFAEMTEAYLGVNDYYPFVRAELKEHDPSGFALMENVWGKVR